MLSSDHDSKTKPSPLGDTPSSTTNATSPINVSTLIAGHAEVSPKTTAIATAAGRDRDGHPVFLTTTFAELNARIDAIAAALQEQGLQPGDRAALFIPDGEMFLTLTYALQRIGAIPVLIDPGMGVPNLVACLREQPLRAFIGIAKAHVLRLLFRRQIGQIDMPIVIGEMNLPRIPSLTAMLERAKSTAPRLHEPDEDAPATIVYTSGSTGVPKGVVYTHAMMKAQADGVAEVGGFSAGEVHVACFPGFALYSSAIGMTTVFPDMDFRKPAAASPQRILEALDVFEAQSAFASPALWTPFAAYLEQHHIDLPRVRALFTAGAPIQPQLLTRLLKSLPNGDVYTPYGATESLPVASINGRRVLDETAEKTAAGQGTCVGRLASGVEVKILPITDMPIAKLDDKLCLAAGEIGEIAVCGPAVTKVYDGNDEATAKAKVLDEHGRVWHRMGDVGYLDDNGDLWFCGRKGHRVETQARTLYSVPCEAIFERDGRVARAALAWVGERPKQTPVMWVELDKSARKSTALVDELRQQAASFDITSGIEHVLVHKNFPVDRRHNAKIEREQLARSAQERLR